MASAFTISRIVLSIALLALPALSPGFLAVYALAGATDMLDGFVARRAGTVSELGAKLDSGADFILVIVCLIKILPVISIPIWLWIWIGAIALIKALNAVSGYAAQKRLVALHTVANKACGLVVFLVPFAIGFAGIEIPGAIACAIATFAVIQEGHFIRTGRTD